MTNKGWWWVSVYLGLKGQGLEQAWFFNLVFSEGHWWHRLASCKWNCEAPSFHKFQQFINWLQSALQKLPPEMEINEYSSSKKITRVLAAALPVSDMRETCSYRSIAARWRLSDQPFHHYYKQMFHHREQMIRRCRDVHIDNCWWVLSSACIASLALHVKAFKPYGGEAVRQLLCLYSS